MPRKFLSCAEMRLYGWVVAAVNTNLVGHGVSTGRAEFNDCASCSDSQRADGNFNGPPSVGRL